MATETETRTVSKRMVCILLECFLVFYVFYPWLLAKPFAITIMLKNFTVMNNSSNSVVDPGFPWERGDTKNLFLVNFSPTRLHSSRMHTACALTVSPTMLCTGGGVSAPGKVSAQVRGVCSQGGVCLQTPPGEQNHTRL